MSEHLLFRPVVLTDAEREFLAAKLGTFRCPSQKLAGVLRGVDWYGQSAEVRVAVDEHVPHMEAARWARIREFVVDSVLLAGPETRYSAKTLITTAAKYVEWAVFKKGFPVHAPVIWSRELIDAYVNDAALELAAGTRRNYRTQLTQISKVVDPAGHAHEYVALNEKNGFEPYSDAEMSEFKRWAVFQRVEARQLRGKLMLVCCAGAGCRAREIGLLTHEDVVETGDGLQLRIGGAVPRTVPLLSEWNEWMEDILQKRPMDQTLWGKPNRSTANNLLSSFTQYSDGTPPRGDRLRNTWLVELLKLRVPMTDLFYAAGAQKLEHLGRLARHISPLDLVEYQRVFRGEDPR